MRLMGVKMTEISVTFEFESTQSKKKQAKSISQH